MAFKNMSVGVEVNTNRFQDISRFLSRDRCRQIYEKIVALATRDARFTLSLDSSWTGNLRWARNHVISSGDVRNHDIWLQLQGISQQVIFNRVDDQFLEAAVRGIERLSRISLTIDPGVAWLNQERAAKLPDLAPEKYLLSIPGGTVVDAPWMWHDPWRGKAMSPAIWSDATYNLDADRREQTMRKLVEPAVKEGLMAAGYLQVSATGRAVLSGGWDLYYPYTQAQYSVTVRDPKGQGSGWAGVDHHDWNQIDAERLTQIALDKCIKSMNPVRIEPGRYTAILEPQAVGDLCAYLFDPYTVLRQPSEGPASGTPYWDRPGFSKLGQRIFDERITVSASPEDPLLGYVPFSRNGVAYAPVTWVKDGVLVHLDYDRGYALGNLGKDLPAMIGGPGAFRMTGGTATIEEMIDSTKRGILVTRFWNVRVIDPYSALSTGYTRDGLWLIEDGKISKPIKNFRFTESPLFVLNNIELLGVPQRIFHPKAPIVVPAMKVRDFSFTSLSDAV
jgi:hypothetical protein